MFQLHLTSWPWDWRWEPGQGSLTLHLAGPLSPRPVSALRSLLSANQFQTLPALTSRPSCPRNIHKAPLMTFSLRVVTLGFCWYLPSPRPMPNGGTELHRLILAAKPGP